MTPPILARVAAQLHDLHHHHQATDNDGGADTSTITTTTSWEYIPKSSSLSDLTRLGAAFSSSTTNHNFNNPSLSHPLEPPTHHNPYQHAPLPPPPAVLPLPHGLGQLPATHNRTSRKNPVLRSASFNVHSPQAKPASRFPRQRHHHQRSAIVLVAENPVNGAQEVYNVPFQQDIYSLPIDTVQQQRQPPAPAETELLNRNGGGRRSITRQTTSTTTSMGAAKPPARWSSLSVDVSDPKLNNLNQLDNNHAAPVPPPPCPNRNVLPPLPSDEHDDDNPPTPPTRRNGPKLAPTSNLNSTSTPGLFKKPLPPQTPLSSSPITHLLKPNHRTFSQVDSGKAPLLPLSSSRNTTGNPAPHQSTNDKSDQPSSSRNPTRFSHEPHSLRTFKTNPEQIQDEEQDVDEPPVPPKRTSCEDSAPVPPVRLHYPDKSTRKPRSRSVDPGNEAAASRQVGGEHVASPGLAQRNPLGLSFLNLFRRNKEQRSRVNEGTSRVVVPPSPPVPASDGSTQETPYSFRELPPPPSTSQAEEEEEDAGSSEDDCGVSSSPLELKDFAASIERVKDCGWYWGPLSSEDAEELLKGEPDGSFIVRDSSDARYIFSLTFKLHGLVRHVRIEHDQGNFSFGPLTRFKASTIVEFVEKAVAHSRSGRYLFFLHRRPVLGPMQVQLLHPYSRFIHPRSLKHMCRFVILKYVRRDLIGTLPLPRPLLDYLSTPHYYFEGSSPLV